MKNIEKWLDANVEDLLSNFFYYDRKEDDIVNVAQMEKLIENDIITKDKLIAVFTKKIEENFE